MKLRLRLLLFSFLGSSLLNLILADPPSYPLYVTTHQNGIINYWAQQIILFQNNTEIAIPFLISIKNYGVLLNNYSLTKAGSETNIDMEFPGDSKIQLLKEFNPAAGTVTLEGSLANTTGKSKQFTLNKNATFFTN